MDGFQPFKFHKKLNAVAYQNFIYLLANFFFGNCIRIKFQSFLSSRKQTRINCETQNPQFQTQLWTDFGHSSCTRNSTWLPTQNFIFLLLATILPQKNAWELSPELSFRRNELASAAVETLNPHSRLNCGRISAIQVPQEAQRGLPTRIFCETRTKTRRKSEYNPRKSYRGDVAGRWRRASYAPKRNGAARREWSYSHVGALQGSRSVQYF